MDPATKEIRLFNRRELGKISKLDLKVQNVVIWYHLCADANQLHMLFKIFREALLCLSGPSMWLRKKSYIGPILKRYI